MEVIGQQSSEDKPWKWSKAQEGNGQEFHVSETGATDLDEERPWGPR